MAFTRLRGSGLWLPNTTILQSELEQLDDNQSRAIDGFGGGAYAPTTPIVIGGQGLDITSRFTAPGLSDIPMRGFFPSTETSHTVVGTGSTLLHWCQFTGAQDRWLAVDGSASLTTQNEETVSTQTLLGSFDPSEDGWSQIASSPTRVVVIGFANALTTPARGVARTATSSFSWGNCSGPIHNSTTTIPVAIVWDGTNFITGFINGQFSTSADGVTFGSAINGPTNWLAGTNTPAAIGAGKGPGGSSDRLIAVATTNSGSTATEYFAISDDHGATWSEIDVGVAKNWKGIVYRSTDHTWLAVATDGTVYVSVDGGASFGALTPSAFSFGGLLLVNDWFVGIGSERVAYSPNGMTWYEGAWLTRSGYTLSNIAAGNGGLGVLLADTGQPLRMRFSQKSGNTFPPVAA